MSISLGLGKKLRGFLLRQFKDRFTEREDLRLEDPPSWFRKAMQKKEFRGRPYLRFAASQNYIKLKKLRQVVDIVAGFARETGIEPRALPIADIGCGYKAIHTLALASLGYRVTAVDVTDVYPQVKERAQGLEVKFLIGDGLSFLEGNREQFHIVMLLDVLEHLADP